MDSLQELAELACAMGPISYAVEEEAPSSSKKKKKKEAIAVKKKKRRGRRADENTTPLRDLPPRFRSKIGAMGGGEITPIIEKSLYASDLNKQQNRLSIPLKKIRSGGFLREGEARALDKEGAMRVTLIQPSLELTTVALAKWHIGLTSSSYVLRSPWNKVALANQLKLNDVVQVWSFRVQQRLCMALVKL